MGTPFAVPYACIYMHEFEQTLFKKMLNSSKFCTMYQFTTLDISTIFLVFSSLKVRQQISLMNSITIIKLKITGIGNIVEILDLIVRISTNDVITTKLYQKRNNMYLYLPPSSFHQPSV